MSCCLVVCWMPGCVYSLKSEQRSHRDHELKLCLPPRVVGCPLADARPIGYASQPPHTPHPRRPCPVGRVERRWRLSASVRGRFMSRHRAFEAAFGAAHSATRPQHFTPRNTSRPLPRLRAHQFELINRPPTPPHRPMRHLCGGPGRLRLRRWPPIPSTAAPPPPPHRPRPLAAAAAASYASSAAAPTTAPLPPLRRRRPLVPWVDPHAFGTYARPC